MRRALKISGWLIFYLGLIAAVLVSLVLYWSYGEKKKIPNQVINKIERVFENISPGSKMFVGDAEIEFKSFSKGLGINLTNSYIQFGNNIVTSIPKIKIKLKVSDLIGGGLRFREVDLYRPKFVVTDDVTQQDMSSSASKDFFKLYKTTVYGLFDRVNKDSNSIPTEKIDLHNAIFSFNKAGKYETWKIKQANLRFFSLQNTTYLSTLVKTELFKRDSEVTINARLLDKEKMMLKVDYKNLSSQAISRFVKGLDWFDSQNPVLNGTSSVILDRAGTSSSASLDTLITYEKPELADTKIGFKGVLDLIKSEDDIIKPKVNGNIYLKDIDMKKLPLLWPEKYGSKVREDVLKNYTKGTFNNVEIGFDYRFDDPEFSNINSEKFSVRGNIENTDVIYNPDFPPVEKAQGSFVYDGDNVSVDLKKGNIDKLVFENTKVSVSGLNDEKTIIEIDGNANGDLTSLKPLLKSILKGRDSDFFYNTHEMKSDAEIKFYYKDNINNGFEPGLVKLSVDAKLKNLEIKDVVKDVNLTSPDLNMAIDENGLSLVGEVSLNQSPSQMKVFVGFVKENDIKINMVSEAQTEVLDKLLPGVARFANGVLELEFQYESEGQNNSFAGKIDSMEADIDFPYFAWNKPKGTFATATFGGQYISNKAIEITDFQLVSSEALSSGNMIISLSDDIADEIYLSALKIGGNDAEIYFGRDKQKVSGSNKRIPAYTIKVNGKAFNASKLIDSFQKLASEDNSLVFDMVIDNLFMANGMKFNNTKAILRCGVSQCYQGNFDAKIDGGGSIDAVLKPEKPDNINGIKTFEVKSDEAGKVVKSFGFSNNVENGNLNISGTIDPSTVGAANATILINDFKITKAPILTKLFSLASFTGILDILTGSGVPMKKLKGNFQMKDDYLAISDLRSYGDSLGFTMQGNIHLNDSDIDLSGAVTPSYSVNSMFGEIPVLGAIFKGKEGEGLIATNYSIKGKYPDVNINVNPFSALTPGFLRKIWGGAETNIDKKKEKVKDKNDTKSNIKQKGFPVNVRPATN